MGAMDLIKTGYIKELMAKGLREDGRRPMAFRKISMKPGVIEHAEGSAQVDLGGTRVLCGVKLDVGEPMRDTPKQGNMMVAAELLQLASPNYESGPPSPAAIELARVVDRGIRAGNCIDLESLYIDEGKVWSVFMDLYILNYDGNLFDACSLAAMSALANTKVPEYRDESVVREERTRALKLNNTVTSTTFAKIGASIVLDTDGNEETAADARITITVDRENIRAMQKGLGGSFTVEEIKTLANESFNKHGELSTIVGKAR